MTLPVDHIHNLDSYITNEGEAFEAPTDKDSVNMDLWVPSELVSLHLVEPPVAPKRKWAELIPWILEDRILQPIEEMHFVDCGQNTDGQIQVLVVSKLDLQNWQRVAQNSAAVPYGMYPDYLALQWEAGRISVGWRDGVCLVRYGALEGFAATPEMSWSMIESLLKEDSGLKVSLSVPNVDLVPQALVELAEINDASRLIQEIVHPGANIYFGSSINDAMGDEIRVTVIAAGFDEQPVRAPIRKSSFSGPNSGPIAVVPENSYQQEVQPEEETVTSVPSWFGNASVAAVEPEVEEVVEQPRAFEFEPKRTNTGFDDGMDIPDFLK